MRLRAFDQMAGLLFRRRERLADALAHARAAVAIARELGGADLLGATLPTQLLTEAALGRPEARATAAETHVFQSASGSARLIAQPLFQLGVVWLWWEELDRARQAFAQLLEAAPGIGDESSVPYVHVLLAQVECAAGEFERAAAHADEGRAIAEQVGQDTVEAYALALRAYADAHRGRELDARDGAATALAGARRTRGTPALHFATAALGLLELSLGHAPEAAAALEPLVAFARRETICEPGLTRYAPDLVEAHVLLGRLDEAEELLAWCETDAVRLARHGALANCLRCRGLLVAARGGDPFPTFERALAEHALAPLPFDRARTLLAYGAALRRANSKRDARTALAEALAEFERLDAAVYAERARSELARIGGRAVPAGDELSETERRIADLVAQGRSNKEVAAALSLSPKTVEWNLSKVYAKLGVRSRAELASRRP